MRELLGMIVNPDGTEGVPEGIELAGLRRTTATLRCRVRIRWDCGGRFVAVFEPDELIEVNVYHDGRTIFTADAEAPGYPGVVDFVDLRDFEVP